MTFCFVACACCCNHSCIGWTTWQPCVNPFKATYHPYDGCGLWRYDLISGSRAQRISCLLDKAEVWHLCSRLFIWALSGTPTYYELTVLRLSLPRAVIFSLFSLAVIFPLFSHGAVLLHFSPPHHRVISHVFVKSWRAAGQQTGARHHLCCFCNEERH